MATYDTCMISHTMGIGTVAAGVVKALAEKGGEKQELNDILVVGFTGMTSSMSANARRPSTVAARLASCPTIASVSSSLSEANSPRRPPRGEVREQRCRREAALAYSRATWPDWLESTLGFVDDSIQEGSIDGIDQLEQVKPSLKVQLIL